MDQVALPLNALELDNADAPSSSGVVPPGPKPRKQSAPKRAAPAAKAPPAKARKVNPKAASQAKVLLDLTVPLKDDSDASDISLGDLDTDTDVSEYEADEPPLATPLDLDCEGLVSIYLASSFAQRALLFRYWSVATRRNLIARNPRLFS